MSEQDSNSDSVDVSEIITRYKIIFVGDAGVGKTSIISRIMGNPFSDSYEPSIGVDFFSKKVTFRDTKIKLQFWDTAGREKYKGLIPPYVRGSSVVFLIQYKLNYSSFC